MRITGRMENSGLGSQTFFKHWYLHNFFKWKKLNTLLLLLVLLTQWKLKSLQICEKQQNRT